MMKSICFGGAFFMVCHFVSPSAIKDSLLFSLEQQAMIQESYNGESFCHKFICMHPCENRFFTSPILLFSYSLKGAFTH